MATLASHKAASGASVAYRRIVVPLDGGAPAVRAACTLADEHGAVVTALAVVEVPAALPLDALMPDEEAAARERLGAAEAVGDRHGVRVVRSTVRARREGEAIVEAAEDADLIVLRRQLDKTARYVLQHAQCRVLFSRPRP